MSEKLSVLIITFNEERNIARCIKSVQEVADDILVLDSFSTDKTKEIALSLGVRFEEHEFDGYIEQKNRAKEMAKYPFVLSLDADEALDETLIKNILKVKENPVADGYTFNRLTNFCGQWVKHGGWYPDKKLRLWKRDEGEWGAINPHDKIQMQAGANVNHIKGTLLHYSFYKPEEYTQQSYKFSKISAENMFQKGKKVRRYQRLFSPLIRFLKGYIFQLGFLDGVLGFRIAIHSAFFTYLKYIQLKDLYQSKSSSSKGDSDRLSV